MAETPQSSRFAYRAEGFLNDLLHRVVHTCGKDDEEEAISG
jgi:hypothetical protein